MLVMSDSASAPAMDGSLRSTVKKSAGRPTSSLPPGAPKTGRTAVRGTGEQARRELFGIQHHSFQALQAQMVFQLPGVFEQIDLDIAVGAERDADARVD